jgi:hypothetical protein
MGQREAYTAKSVSTIKGELPLTTIDSGHGADERTPLHLLKFFTIRLASFFSVLLLNSSPGTHVYPTPSRVSLLHRAGSENTYFCFMSSL